MVTVLSQCQAITDRYHRVQSRAERGIVTCRNWSLVRVKIPLKIPTLYPILFVGYIYVIFIRSILKKNARPPIIFIYFFSVTTGARKESMSYTWRTSF